MNKPPARPADAPSLLLIEDDGPSARALAMILRRSGWAVDVVDTVGAALTYLETHTPNAVILDLMLPDGSGVTVLQSMRDRGQAIPVAVTTASADSQALNRVHALGVHAIIRKPIDLPELLRVLESGRPPGDAS